MALERSSDFLFEFLVNKMSLIFDAILKYISFDFKHDLIAFKVNFMFHYNYGKHTVTVTDVIVMFHVRIIMLFNLTCGNNSFMI